MLNGDALFAGVKSFVSKNNVNCRLVKLINPDSGELAEVFVQEGVSIPEIPLMTKVKVSIDWRSIGRGTSYSLISIARG